MKNKTKYYLFIGLLVFIGLIVAVGLLVAAGLTFNVFFTEGIRDLLFVPQFAILAAVYFLVFPVIMVLISNVYFKASGKKTWGNWLKIALNYNSVFTVIAVYQCAFIVIEILVFCTINYASAIIEKVIMFTVPFAMFFLSKKILKKLFGHAELDGVSETGEEEKTDPKNFTIRQPVSALVIYIVLSVFFLLLYMFVLIGAVDGGEKLSEIWWFYFLCMSPFILFGPFLIIIRSRWKIIIKGEKITSTTYFGKTKSCTFGDITRVKQGVGHTKMGTIYSMTAYNEKKKLFAVASNCPGYDVLVQRFKDEGY